MELPLRVQALLLACTLLTGLGLGALYDLLRVLRERLPAAPGLALDALYCFCFGAAMFLLGMGPGRGTLRLYMPPLALAGAGLWFFLFGGAVRNALRRGLDVLGRAAAMAAPPLRRGQEALRRGEKKLKRVFSFAMKRLIIQVEHCSLRRRASGGEEQRDEAEAFQHLYEDCGGSADRLRGDDAGQRPRTHRLGGGRSGRAGGGGRDAAPGESGASVPD
ncbi:MAG: spore cortex biosynthesis protein YabQ [Oscillospiraceae bacterium]|nr:spore cortex biosynthesis protein YabQ [Oscillospiraceae bacterium]